MGITVVGAKPGVMEIDAFGVNFFNQRIVRFAVERNPVGHQQPVGFEFAFDFGQSGILLFLEFDPVFFQHPFKAAIGSAGFGGLGLFDDFVNGLLLAESVQNKAGDGWPASPVVGLFIKKREKPHGGILAS